MHYAFHMSKKKAVQARIDQDLYKDAKVGLAKDGSTWQRFLESHIKMKYGKGSKNGSRSK